MEKTKKGLHAHTTFAHDNGAVGIHTVTECEHSSSHILTLHGKRALTLKHSQLMALIELLRTYSRCMDEANKKGGEGPSPADSILIVNGEEIKCE